MIAYAISIQYLIAGYSVIFIALTAYLASLLFRWQRLKQDLHILENLAEQK